jgi:hypothetical protein
MNMKRMFSTSLLLLLLSALSMLGMISLLTVKASGPSDSPYIMVKPETTLDSTYTVGTNYTVSIYTNYNITYGSDVYMWQFSLTFDPSVLEGLKVSNGDLITTAKDSSATFAPGTFNNTIGKLSLTIAYFYHISPPPFRTTGPGTLANVTFRVKGYGFSDIHISDSVSEFPAVLGGYNVAEGGYYEIVDGTLDPEKLGHGYFRNGLAGDANLDKTVNVFDILAVKSRWGRTPVSPDWIREYDVNDDEAINVFDILTVKANWGQTAP